MKMYERGELPREAWLDKLVFNTIAESRKSKESTRDRSDELLIDFPLFEVPVLVEKTFPVKRMMITDKDVSIIEERSL